MAGKELRANIVLGGRTDPSLAHVGAQLEMLGNKVNQISSRLIDFGKESVQTYVDYEDAMLDAQVALSTQYTTTSELGKVMEQLDKSAMAWAASSRFTTDDVANAISNAAHAGWDLEQILGGVPAAMNISLAGGMNLAQGLEYLVDITNAAGLQFDELGQLTDYWAYAANSSSTTIPEMGEAMQKMGATLQFVKGDMAGLTTMLAVLADNGTKGSEAGTLLRNSMIRLIAPTKKAAEAMDSLELSEEDLEDVYSDTEGLEEAVGLLKEAGFNAYDSKGNLKNFLTIWKDLQKATAGMTEEERNQVLSAVFPTRTITGALALLEAAGKDWDGLYQSILDHAEGYADRARDTMESGLGGSLRGLEAAWDVLEAKVGKELSSPVEGITDSITDFINAINGLDDARFSMLVSGLEGIAVAGPALITAGGALKLISSLGVGGGIALAAVALLAFGAAVSSLNESIYADKFGDLELDKDGIGQYLESLGASFQTAEADISKYNTAVETAVSDYSTASGTFKESLLTTMLTGATLSEQDIATLNGLGEQMRQAMIAGIDGSYSAAEETLAQYAGDTAENVAADDSLWSNIMDTLNYGYENAVAQAEGLSQQLREAMTAAFKDGKLTSEEIDNIQSIIDQQNELLAIQTDARNATERQKLLRQAQTLGLSGLSELSGMAQAQRDAELATLEDNYWQTYYQTQLGGQMKIRDGVMITDPVTHEKRLYTQADLDKELEDLYSGDANNPYDGYEGQRHAAEASTDRFLLDLWNSTILGSELKDTWNGLGELADSYIAMGALTSDDLNAYTSGYDSVDRSDTARYVSELMQALGGYATVQERADYYAATGDLESANAFSRLLAMYTLADAQTPGMTTPEQPKQYAQTPYSVEDARAQNEALRERDGMTDLAWDYFADAMKSGYTFDFENLMSGNVTDTGFQSGIQSITERLGEVYDLAAVEVPEAFSGGIRDYAAAWRLMFDESINAEDYRLPVEPQVDTEQVEQQLGEMKVPVEIQPRQAGEGLSDLEGQGVEVSVDGDTTELTATINAEDGKNLLEYVSGDATELSMAIYDQDGQTLTENVTGDASELEDIIASYNGRIITVQLHARNTTSKDDKNDKKKYAEGGRATEASIFGEAGPEWAIPEEHSQRTAQLLNSAREASGFTWDELLSRNGGLNAGGGGSRTLVYSPTIYANDATGVEAKLSEDKARLEKMLREKDMRDDIEVYA